MPAVTTGRPSSDADDGADGSFSSLSFFSDQPEPIGNPDPAWLPAGAAGGAEPVSPRPVVTAEALLASGFVQWARQWPTRRAGAVLAALVVAAAAVLAIIATTGPRPSDFVESADRSRVSSVPAPSTTAPAVAPQNTSPVLPAPGVTGGAADTAAARPTGAALGRQAGVGGVPAPSQATPPPSSTAAPVEDGGIGGDGEADGGGGGGEVAVPMEPAPPDWRQYSSGRDYSPQPERPRGPVIEVPPPSEEPPATDPPPTGGEGDLPCHLLPPGRLGCPGAEGP